MNSLKDIKKIDIHVHASLFSDIAPETLLSGNEVVEIYDKLNIEAGVLLPLVETAALTTIRTSEQCKVLSDNSNGRLKWFCNVSPYAVNNTDNSDLSEVINHYKKLGAQGVGEITTQLYADDSRMDNLFYHCTQTQMPVIIHMSTGFGGTYGIVDDIKLPRLEKMLKKHKDLKIIGHSQVFWSEISDNLKEEERTGYPTGKVKDGRIAELMREYGNLYCDLSAGSGANAMMRDKEYAARFLEEFADRIYYGTDINRRGAVYPYEFSDFLAGMVNDGYLTKKNYIKIVRNNAAKLLDMQEYNE